MLITLFIFATIFLIGIILILIFPKKEWPVCIMATGGIVVFFCLLILGLSRNKMKGEIREYIVIKTTIESMPRNYSEGTGAVSKMIDQNKWLAEQQYQNKFWWDEDYMIPDEIDKLSPIVIQK